MQLLPLVSDYIYIPLVIALIGAVFSSYTDVKTGKIKNYVTFPMIIIGWSWSLVFGDLNLFVMNVIISVLVGFVAKFGGMLGHGDVKLLMGMAACMQPLFNINLIIFYFITSLVVSVGQRIKINNYDIKYTLREIKNEMKLELGGAKMIGYQLHGDKLKKKGAPIILTAFVLSVVKVIAEGAMLV